MNKSKALLFINGEAPAKLPLIDQFQLIACTDGAFHYLKQKSFPLERLDFISGDFDSLLGADQDIYQSKFIHTPDQNKTDFHKALEIILDRGITEVFVYGASGREQDHFIGNLHTAYLFRDRMKILFFDEYASYFFIPERIMLHDVKGKMISILPFPFAEGVQTHGLKWELKRESLSLTERIGTRNVANEDEISIAYTNGAIVLFIGN